MIFYVQFNTKFSSIKQNKFRKIFANVLYSICVKISLNYNVKSPLRIFVTHF